MSLINQMLRDLESRRKPELPPGGIFPGEGGAGNRADNSKRRLILILLIVLMLLGISSSYLWLQNRKMQESLASSPAPVDAPIDASGLSVTAPAPVSEPQRQQRETLPPKTTTVRAAPQRSNAATTASRQPPARREPRTVNLPPSQLNSISPSVLDGSWQQRTLTLRGEGLSSKLAVVVSWNGKEKLLPADQVEWQQSSRAQIKLVTGNSDEIWRVALQRPDGSRSRSVEFEVIASPLASGGYTPSLARGSMEKTIRPPSATERADKLYKQGYQALQQRQPQKAEQLWQQALKSEPKHLRTREGLVALLLSQNRRVETTRLLQEGIELHPESSQLALIQARLQAEQGDNLSAIATLERAMQASPPTPELLALAAALHQQQGNYAQSINHYQRALQLQPQNSNWWMGLGISLENSGKQSEAVLAYKEALQRGGLAKKSKAFVEQRLGGLG